MNAEVQYETDEILKSVDRMVKDSEERDRRFQRLMQTLNVPQSEGIPLLAKDNLSAEEKQQAEVDLMRWFDQVNQLNVSNQHQSKVFIPESPQPQNGMAEEKGEKPRRPIGMRGLSI